MERIRVYTIPRGGPHVVTMPRGTRILSVTPSKGGGAVYALIDTAAPLEHRRFLALGTEATPPARVRLDTWAFAGTVPGDETHEPLHLFYQ